MKGSTGAAYHCGNGGVLPGFLWNVTIWNILLKSRDFIAFEPDLRYTIYGLLCLPGEVKNLGQCADIEIMKKLAGGECHDEHSCG